jgi:hypothetical protein
MLQRAATAEIGGDPCRPKRVVADRRMDASRYSAPADHQPRCRLVHRLPGQHDAVVPGVVRNSQPLRSSAIPAASM